MLNYQQNSNNNFISYVVQILNDSDKKSVTAYAISSFIETFKRHGITDLNEESLKLWIAYMFMNKMSIKTVQRYAGKIHSIFNTYNKENKTDVSDPFINVLPLINETFQVDDTDIKFNLEILKRLFDKNESSPEWQLINLFFYLLYNAEVTLSDAVNATFDNAPKYCPQIDEIVHSRDKSNGRKYLFSLKQKQIRPSQILSKLTTELSYLMNAVGMKVGQGLVRDNITALWIAVALKLGVDIRHIRAIIPAVPYQYRALQLISKSEISEERKQEIICKVADAINDNTPRWFVMKLRKGVSLDAVKDKVEKELPGRLNTMQLFYPTRITYSKKGNKKVKEETPYVPDLLFFQTQYNKVRSMFAKVGDLAYCLKTTNLPESPYSIISHEQMANFQKCVGQFTPDIRLELVDTSRDLGKGRMVRITGGMMKGYKGKIVDIDESKGIRMFSLRVSLENALNWTAEVEDVFIEPIEI